MIKDTFNDIAYHKFCYKQSSNTIELIKYSALFFMVIDHAGIILFENDSFFRMIGRISFPLFAYILVHNYIYFTKNKIKFIQRLLLFGIISEPIHFLLIDEKYNVFLLFTISLSVIYIFELINSFNIQKRSINIFHFFIIIFLGGVISIFSEFNIFGYIFILILFITFKYPSLRILNLFTLGIINLKIFYLIPTYFSVIVVYFSSKISFTIPRINKWFFYIFYPLHILILYIISI